jgi:hypothetical protein
MERWFLRFLLERGRLRLPGLAANLLTLARWPLRTIDLKLFYLAGPLPVRLRPGSGRTAFQAIAPPCPETPLARRRRCCRGR